MIDVPYHGCLEQPMGLQRDPGECAPGAKGARYDDRSHPRAGGNRPWARIRAVCPGTVPYDGLRTMIGQENFRRLVSDKIISIQLAFEADVGLSL
jgi:hypothetical protein